MKSQMLPRDASESYPPELSRAGGSWGRSRGGGPSVFAPAAAARFAISRTSHELPQYERSCLSKRARVMVFGALRCRAMARRCPPGGFGFGAVMLRVHATRARVPCTRLWEGFGGWVQGWGRERQPIGSRCYVRGARAAASRRREPHKNPKQRTLQPPTLNPSAVVVFSRCHRDVRGDASQPVGRRITRCLLVSRRTDSLRRCAQRPSDARTSSHTPFRTTRQQGSSSFVRRDHHARLRCAAPGRKEIILNTSVVSVSRMPPMPTRLETSRGERADCAISRVSPRSRRA